MSAGKERIQTVVFMRHSVAKHNVVDGRTNQPPNLEDPAFFDPPLTLIGKQTALQAGSILQEWFQPQLVLTSPLTRCIQTSVLVTLPGEYYSTDSQQRPPKSTMVIESLREACGKHQPDQRRSKTILKEYWPQLDFTEMQDDGDTLWRPDQRETWQDVERRVQEFWNWLVQRPEESILVVTHGVWMECCLRQHLSEHQRVYNCDAFAGKVVSTDGAFVRLQQVQQIYSQHRSQNRHR